MPLSVETVSCSKHTIRSKQNMVITRKLNHQVSVAALIGYTRANQEVTTGLEYIEIKIKGPGR